MRIVVRVVKNWHWRIEIKWFDCWIGVYWKRSIAGIDIYICLLPCIPIHIWQDVYHTDALLQEFGASER